jgi:hypothetical protein
MMSMREFRATIAQIEEPVKVGNGLWFPESSPILEAIADGVATVGVGVDVALIEKDDERLVVVIQKREE